MNIPTFEELLPLYDDYYRKMDATDPSFNNDLAIEGRKRIVQLHKVLSLMGDLNRKHDDILGRMTEMFSGGAKVSRGEMKEHGRLLEDLEMYADMFYWIAHRLLVILENLPDLKGVKRACKGIVLTRNHLLEHPEGKDSQVYIQGFAVGSWGPIVKAIRYDNQRDVFPANPLYEDAQVMNDKIIDYLKKSL